MATANSIDRFGIAAGGVAGEGGLILAEMKVGPP
jgi:hypothetical protein